MTKPIVGALAAFFAGGSFALAQAPGTAMPAIPVLPQAGDPSCVAPGTAIATQYLRSVAPWQQRSLAELPPGISALPSLGPWQERSLARLPPGISALPSLGPWQERSLAQLPPGISALPSLGPWQERSLAQLPPGISALPSLGPWQERSAAYLNTAGTGAQRSSCPSATGFGR